MCAIISQRFDDADEPVSGTLLRCVYFVIGPLMSAIKLAAMQGAPWTKAYGMMFLVSFLVVEELTWFLWWDGARRDSTLEKVEQGRLKKRTADFPKRKCHSCDIQPSDAFWHFHLGYFFWLLPRLRGMGTELGAPARIPKHVVAIGVVFTVEFGYFSVRFDFH